MTTLLLLAPLALPADLAAAPSVRRVADPARSAVLYDERDDAIWARGSDWKARFDRAGATFVPFLGSDAPRTWPLAFGAPRVRAGDRALELASGVAPVRAGDALRFDRGVVDELYLAMPHGIEQRFVVERPIGAGAIVVDVPVATELEVEVDGAALRFTGERGGVDYGGATAIDADGRALALERTWTGDAIRIVVPAPFAASARYPLVIDPIVATFDVFAPTPQLELSPDVAFDETAQKYLAVSEVAFSLTDHDVVSVLLERDGSAVPGGALAVDASDEYWATPRCAGLAFQSGFAVVAAVGIPVTSSRSIRVRLREAASFAAAIHLSNADDGDNHSPDIGGGDTSVSVRYCAVWQSDRSGDSEINGRVIPVDGTPMPPIEHISNDVASDDRHPSVSSGGGGNYEVVFDREIAANDHDVWYAIMQNGGVLVSGPAVLVGGPTDDTYPVVSDVSASVTLRAMVAFQRDGGGNLDVVVAEHQPGLTLGTVIQVSALDPASAPFEQFAPVIESDGHRFVLAWCERDNSGTRILATEYHAVFQAPVAGLSRVVLSTSASDAREVRLAGRTALTGPNLGVMGVWTDDASGSARDVFGVRYEPEAGLPAVPYCFGDGSGVACPCGNVGAAGRGCPNSVVASGALLASSGAATTVDDTLVLLGSGMPPNSTCLYFQGDAATGNAFGDGLRCASGSTVRLGTKLNSPAGASQYPQAGDASVSVRGSVFFGGGDRYYQVWYRNAAAFCTVATFNLTNGLRAPWSVL